MNVMRRTVRDHGGGPGREFLGGDDGKAIYYDAATRYAGVNRATATAREYRRLRALQDGASYSRLEAFGRAIADIERERRHPARPGGQ